MARLILLSISTFLLLAFAFESSSAWPYPDDEEDTVTEMIQGADGDDDETLRNLKIMNEQAVKMRDDGDDTGDEEDTKEKAVQEDDDEENAVALANFDDNLNADIEQAGACGCNLKAFDNTNYRGRMLLVKQQNANFLNDYFNNRVESIRIIGHCDWLIYQHPNFLGTSYLLRPLKYSRPGLWGGRKNQISSARALPLMGTVAIVLFQYPNYRGRMLTLYGSHNNLQALNFNNQVSSFIITGGRWTLYKRANFRGKKVTRGPGRYSSSSSWKSCYTPGNNQISSVKKIYNRYD